MEYFTDNLSDFIKIFIFAFYNSEIKRFAK